MIPRPEHPNPQFERRDWINLNGEWEFEIDAGKSGMDRKFYERTHLDAKIIVPFCPESKLSGVENKDFMPAVWYKREFDIPPEWETGHIFLHFGAVDYETHVYLNQKEVGMHQGGYASFQFDISAYVRTGKNTLTVCAIDDTKSPLQPRGKQSERYFSHVCDYTRTTGIWQTVWLEHVPEAYIKSVQYYPDIENSRITIAAETVGAAKLRAEAFFGGNSVGQAELRSAGGTVHMTLELSELHLWEPGAGNLYDLQLSYGTDAVQSYFGMRRVRLEGMKFLINNISVFQRLVLDQGFYKDGIYTAPDEGRFIQDIELSLAAGFNGARLHQKVFEPRFLYHCDRMGYLVWGEYGNWGIDYSRAEVLAPVLKEWAEVVERDFNHPSIIGWCPFNETWDYDGRKQRDTLLETVYRFTKQLDPTRPCIDTSGNYHVETDIFDVHDYEQDPAVFQGNYDRLMTEHVLFNHYENRQTYRGEPVFVSEYGGIQWDADHVGGWGYGNGPKTEEEFLERYRGLTDALLDNDAMFGFCYTQLYDVEQEVNGLYTYDRKPKFDMGQIRKINLRRAKIEE